MSHGDGTEGHGEERHAQLAGLDTLAPLAGLQLVELQDLALMDSLQVFMTGMVVQTPWEEPQVHILAHQQGLRAQEQGEQGQAQDHQQWRWK